MIKHYISSIFLVTVVVLLTACGGGGNDPIANNEKPDTYTVNTNVGMGGNISPRSANVGKGETVTFKISTNNGYSINRVSGCNGTLVGDSFTTGPISTNCTVTVSFVALPVLSIADASVLEGNSGITNLSFTVTLSTLANGNVDVSYSTSDVSATAGSDYIAVSNGTLTIPAGSTEATIAISIYGDTTQEDDETFTLTLSNPSANAVLGSAVATGTIVTDDVTPITLNDTGITICANETSSVLPCPQVSHPGQDAEYGRDAQAQAGTLTKVGAGNAGFDFTKLDSNGNPLPDQTVTYTTTPWSCVRDNHTGLEWEVKSTDGGLRDWFHTYTWYKSTGNNDGGGPGVPNGGSCVDNTNCDTEKYVAAINAIALCGYSDWRLPTVDELATIVDSSVPTPGPTIDRNYFPNTRSARGFWTSTPHLLGSEYAWEVNFSSGSIDGNYKNAGAYVRLVRGGKQ